MPILAVVASLRTVSTIQASSALRGWSIMCRPMLVLAMVLLISSEMMAPVKPITKAYTSRLV